LKNRRRGIQDHFFIVGIESPHLKLPFREGFRRGPQCVFGGLVLTTRQQNYRQENNYDKGCYSFSHIIGLLKARLPICEVPYQAVFVKLNYYR